MVEELISFCVFDGIPPQKEGEDPTIFWYYPENVPENDQLNMTGLYLTFIWFSRDFKASKDCEFFQTDKTFCCFCHLGEQIYCAATFKYVDAARNRYRINQMEVFRNVFSVIFSAPTRDPETNMVEKNSDFSDNFGNLLGVLNQPPLLLRLAPSLDLWNSCEEALAIAKYSMPNIRSAAFIYKDRLLHTSMHPSDALALYTSYKAKVKRLFSFAPEPKENTFQWLTGLCKIVQSEQIITFLPTVNLHDGLVLVATIRYNDLILFVALLMPKEINKEAFQPLEDALKPLLPKIVEKCNAKLALPQSSKITSYREDGLLKITSPMNVQTGVIANQTMTGSLVDALNNNESDFVRFCEQVDNEHWMFMEKDGKQTTIVEETAPNLPEAVSSAVTYIRMANLG